MVLRSKAITIRASGHFGRRSVLCMASPFYTKLHTNQNAAALGVIRNHEIEEYQIVLTQSQPLIC